MNTTFNCLVFCAFLLCECSFFCHCELGRSFLRDGAEIQPQNDNHKQVERNCNKEVTVTGKDGHTGRVDLPYPKHGVPRRYLADKSAAGDEQLLIPTDVFLPPPPPPPTKKSSQSQKRKNNSNQDIEDIIIAVGAISGVVIIVGTALIICLTRGEEVSYEEKQSYDKPLQITTSNDLADGSPMDPSDKKLGREGSFKSPSDSPTEVNQESSGNTDKVSLQQEKPSLLPPPPPSVPPPPPPKKAAPPLPPKGRAPPAPPGARRRTSSTDGDPTGDSDSKKTKMKPFFWDKMTGNANQAMVWDEIRGGSFVFNEEMMEALFGYNPDDKKGDRGRSAGASQPQFIQIIDPKKAQNLSILLKALNVTTEEVHDALVEGNELPVELLQNLLRMAPTQEEELKLRLYTGPLEQIGPADRFLKIIIDIPFAFKRMESLVFMITFKEEVTNVKESFHTLEVACDELTKSRLFLKLLEAVLKTGNRMNNGTYRGDAQAFKLDTLLKLADVKGLDGKTTLLHFVVQEIVRAEGMKAIKAARENQRISSIKSDVDFIADDDPSFIVEPQNCSTRGLQIVSSISNELQYVKKAAIIDGDVSTTVSKLNQSLLKIKAFISNDMPSEIEEHDEFFEALTSFVSHSEGELAWLKAEEKKISELVKQTTDSFHGNTGKDEGLRLFVIVRDFLRLLDRICEELKKSFAQQTQSIRKERLRGKSMQDQRNSFQEMRQRLFPTISAKQVNESSSDDDDDDDNDSKSISSKAETSSKRMSPEKRVEDESSLDGSKTTIQDRQKSTQDNLRQRLSPAVAAKRVDDSSSDSGTDSDSDNIPKKTQTPGRGMLSKTTHEERRSMQDMRLRLPHGTPTKRLDESTSYSDSNSLSRRLPTPSQRMSQRTTEEDQHRRSVSTIEAKHADESTPYSDSNSLSRRLPTPSKRMSQRTTEEDQHRRSVSTIEAKHADESSSESFPREMETSSKETSHRESRQDQQQLPRPDTRQQLFHAIAAKRVDDSSSDSE